MPLPMKLPAAALALAALAAAAGPAAAGVPAIKSFKVTAEGSGTYERADRQMFQGLGWESSTSAQFSYKVVIPEVWFDSGGDIIGQVGDGKEFEGWLKGEGKATMTIHGMDGDRPVKRHGSCDAPLQTRPNSTLSLKQDEDAPAAADGDHLILRPVAGIAFAASCGGAMENFNMVTVWGGDQPHAFDQRFFLPKEATDMGKIIQLVEQSPAQTAQVNCPGVQWNVTESCTFRWKGTITFERLKRWEVDPEPDLEDVFIPLPEAPAPPAPPAPPAEPAPAPAAPPARSHPAAQEELLRLARAVLSGGTASVRVACAGGCAGTVSAYPLTAKAATRRRSGRPLATKRFRVRDGATAKVALRFTGRARGAVRRAGGVELVVEAGRARETVVVRR